MGAVALPALFGGVNGLSASNLIQPNQAVALYNWIPGDNYLSTRGATTQYSSTFPGTYIYSAWPNSTGNVVLGGNNALYRLNVAAPIASGFSSDFWHGNQFQDLTILCNGADTPQAFNGTTATALVVSGSGLTASLLYGSLTFKGRVYYWDVNGRYFWYAVAGAYQGTLAKFDLSKYMQSDGYVVSLATLTNDGGDGPDDLFVVLTSNGECLVYQGDDPGSAMGWQLAGRFKIPKPLGRTCWANIGSTTIVGTQTGVVDLLTALKAGPGDRSATFGSDLGDYWLAGDVTDVQFCYDATQEILWAANWNQSEFVDNGLNQVFGMDVSSRAWFLTDGIAYRGIGTLIKKATAMVQFGARVYFVSSGSGVVYTAPTRTADGLTTDAITGQDINYYGVSGFLPLGSLSQKKQVCGVALDMRTYGAVTPNVTNCALAILPETMTPQTTLTYATSASGVLDGLYRTDFPCYGEAFQYSLTMTGKGGVLWYSTRLLVNPGGEL